MGHDDHPRIVVKVCKNGLMLTRDALRSIRCRCSNDEGVIDWSLDTQRKTSTS